MKQPSVEFRNWSNFSSSSSLSSSIYSRSTTPHIRVEVSLDGEVSFDINDQIDDSNKTRCIQRNARLLPHEKEFEEEGTISLGNQEDELVIPGNSLHNSVSTCIKICFWSLVIFFGGSIATACFMSSTTVSAEDGYIHSGNSSRRPIKSPFLRNLNRPVQISSNLLQLQSTTNKNINKKDADTIRIKDPSDLKEISNSPSRIEVFKLAKPLDPKTLSRSKHSFYITVTHLLIQGITSEEWLLYLLGFLTELDYLYLNVDSLCEGSAVRDRKTLETIRHSNLRHLHLENSSICKIIDWILGIELNDLKSIVLTNVQFNRDTFKGLLQFFEKYKNSLELVRFERYKFSEECNLTLIPANIKSKIQWEVN